jgi:hypothetical protein
VQNDSTKSSRLPRTEHDGLSAVGSEEYRDQQSCLPDFVVRVFEVAPGEVSVLEQFRKVLLACLAGDQITGSSDEVGLVVGDLLFAQA